MSARSCPKCSFRGRDDSILRLYGQIRLNLDIDIRLTVFPDIWPSRITLSGRPKSPSVQVYHVIRLNTRATSFIHSPNNQFFFYPGGTQSHVTKSVMFDHQY